MMPLRFSSKLGIALAWGGILLAGAAVGSWNAHRRESELNLQVVRGATRASIGFDADEIRTLDPASPEAPKYRAVAARLRKFRSVDPRIRDIYVLRIDPTSGRIDRIASATGAGPASVPSMSSTLEQVLRTGVTDLEGPLTDEIEEWMTGWALIEDPTPYPLKHVLGLDIDAAGWRIDKWRAGFEGALYCWLLFGLPFLAWLVMRRQHEQREVIRNLSEAMEQSHSAIVIMDLEMCVEYANRGLCQQMGYTRRELIGRGWREFHEPVDGDTALTDMVATVRAGRPWEGEWQNRRKDGTTYPVRGVVTPVKHRDGSLACFVGVFDDVTETKAREAELRDARDAALAGDRAKGQFLATMSHEVRTPLNGIVGFTSLLLETPLTGEQREYVQTIRMSTEALIQLTGDILDFARIESGKLKLDPLASDPRECVEDALDLLAAKAAEKKIELLHRVAADVPAAVVVDGGRLRQVLVNLVGNAVKFTERGEVEVAIGLAPAASSHSASENGRHAATDMCTLLFEVRDTGIGIAPEHHPKLFRPFTQVDESTTRRYGGTGLGLAICRNLVELMGGHIHVASMAGHGSTFSFTIRVPVAAPIQPKRNLDGLLFGLAVRSAPLRRELAELVASWNAQVIAVEQSNALLGRNWDLALIEVGDEAARELAAVPPLAGLPVEKCLGLVPISLPNYLRTALRSHFRLLVNKPVHHAALFNLLAGTRPESVPVTPPTQFGLRVLAVEDNLVNQRLILRVLSNLGCSATLVTNGRDAVTQLAARAEEFDLVLLDLHMPEMDGVAALREIRAGRAGVRAQTIWIIALTADAREQQRARAMEAGLNDYLTKPLNIAELEASLRRFRTERMARKR